MGQYLENKTNNSEKVNFGQTLNLKHQAQSINSNYFV